MEAAREEHDKDGFGVGTGMMVVMLGGFVGFNRRGDIFDGEVSDGTKLEKGAAHGKFAGVEKR